MSDQKKDNPGGTGRTPISPRKRVITILQADIVDSTRIISRLDPDDASDFLDPIVEAMTEAVHRYGGEILRVEGDGVKAAFGTLRSDEDHALRAVLAGLRIRDRCSDRSTPIGKLGASIRVGVHSGFAIVRWQGNDFGGGLDTVGPVAHIASKLQSTAPINQVRVSAATFGLLAGLFRRC